MQKRERILAILTGVLAVVFVAKMGFEKVTGAVTYRNDQVTILKSQIQEKKLRILAGERARRVIHQWELRSLPTNREQAFSNYYNWLQSIATEAGLDDLDVGPLSGGTGRRSDFTTLRFDVRGDATLEEAVKFLHAFYQAGHLHQIKVLTLKPDNDGRLLTMNLKVDALILPGADRTDTLTELEGDSLAIAELDDYLEPIVERNLFARYQPPRPVRENRPPPAAPRIDHANWTYITGIVESRGERQVWIQRRTINDEVLRFGEGEVVRVVDPQDGQVNFEGTITRIGIREVEIESDLGRQVFAVGDNLRKPVRAARVSDGG